MLLPFTAALLDMASRYGDFHARRTAPL